MVFSALNKSEYGKTWLYIPDGNNELQVANLTEITDEEENDAKGRSGMPEKDINFLLYTR